MLARLIGQHFDRMVMWVPPGCFQMGSDPTTDHAAQFQEQPQHTVCITHGFWIGAYEVTNREYQPFIDSGGYQEPAYWSAEGWAWLHNIGVTGPQRNDGFTDEWEPRVGVSWYEAEAYVRWRGCRLPTEAEWEYAARGPDSSIYPWGNAWDSSKVNAEGTVGHTSRVGNYDAGRSWVGAYDMAGNVWEWVADWWDATYYQGRVRDDPSGAVQGSNRVSKGGSWIFNRFNARAAVRNLAKSDGSFIRRNDIGFRVVC
jgi:formylglycine-generating enzyme required for sulfatase activity